MSDDNPEYTLGEFARINHHIAGLFFRWYSRQHSKNPDRVRSSP